MHGVGCSNSALRSGGDDARCCYEGADGARPALRQRLQRCPESPVCSGDGVLYGSGSGDGVVATALQQQW